jgi:membrane protease YdiL (CAAX protease family)
VHTYTVVAILLNQRSLNIGWNLFVVAVVLAVTTFAPAWQSVLGAAIALILSRIGPPPWRCEIGLRKPRHLLATLAGGILSGVVLFFLIKLFLQHLCEIITHSQRDLSAFDFTRGHLREQFPLIIQVAVTAGVCEEIIYRGTVISRLQAILPKGRTTKSLVLLFSAAIFGAAHAYQAPAGILVTGLIGLLLGLIYLAFGRLLWPAILMHVTYDLLSQTAISSNLDRVLNGWSLALFSWIGFQ